MLGTLDQSPPYRPILCDEPPAQRAGRQAPIGYRASARTSRFGLGQQAYVIRWSVALLTGIFGASFAAEFSEIEPLLQKHCFECHSATEPEGGLVLETYADLQKGGESGPVLVAGKAGDSLLVKVLTGNWGKTGKNQFMPPGKRDKLTPEQVAVVQAWIDAGAPGPKPGSTPSTSALVVPKISPKGVPRRPINGLAFEPRARLLAIARPGSVELLAPDTQTVVQTLTGTSGSVNAVAFSGDGEFVFGGGGQPGQAGEIRQWRTASGELVRVFSGPRDAIQAISVSADGTILAGGSYDYGISLWDIGTGIRRHSIAAHQGAVMGLAFRPDGRVLASVSFDRTAKLYNPADGNRLETFGQALKELNTLAISPDGQTLLTGGSDNRIRAYRLSPDGREGSNPLLATVFAHEGSLLQLVYSPDGKTVASAADDRTVKLFTVPELTPRIRLETQPDWPTSLAFIGPERLAVGRADGSLGLYNTSDGKVWSPPPPPKPELTQVEPRGVQTGVETHFILTGKNLMDASVIKIYTDHLTAVLRGETTSNQLHFTYLIPEDLARRSLDFAVSAPSGESGRMKVWADDLPQTRELQLNLPVDAWGTLVEPGRTLNYTFNANAGQTLMFDLAAERLGTRGDYTLALLDATGHTLAFNDTYANQADPLLIYTFTVTGPYQLRVAEATFGGSPEHTFRVTAGELPFVTGLFPLTLPAHVESVVQFAGANLPHAGRLQVTAGESGSMDLPIEAKKWRSRRDWKFEVTDWPAPLEVEPNDRITNALSVPVPAVINGRVDAPGDVDLYRFTADAGQTYVLETAAARRGSTADTRIEILWPDGRPVELIRLQAVRNSAVTFRAADANGTGIRFENWEEMALNDFLFCGGEVMKLFRAPQGPDSDSILYAAGGKRRAWFETSATAHYLDEPVYVVTPVSPNGTPIANGLPLITLNHLNDDAARRDLGSDSRLLFRAPISGDYLIRVDDSQGAGGPTAGYALTLRPAIPDFKVRLTGAPTAVARGSGQGFSISLDRLDGFEGAVEVEFLHLPPGWSVSHPVRIEAGHESANLTLNAVTEAQQPDDAMWDAVRVVASAKIDHRAVAVEVNRLGRPRLLAETPKLLVSLEPSGVQANAGATTVPIRPGSTAQARLKIQRNGFNGVVVFSLENLPHGVIVENLGLNGITFLSEENEREISIAAAPWVSELERPFHAVENQAGRQTSRPLVLQVRRPPAALTAESRNAQE